MFRCLTLLQKFNSYIIITAGRYCEWQHLTVDKSEFIETFDEYKKTLRLQCDAGDAAVLNWTVAADTPDLVYYQV